MTMEALYVKPDTGIRLRELIRVKSDSIRETNAIPEYQGITADNMVNWLIETAKKYYKLGDA